MLGDWGHICISRCDMSNQGCKHLLGVIAYEVYVLVCVDVAPELGSKLGAEQVDFSGVGLLTEAYTPELRYVCRYRHNNRAGCECGWSGGVVRWECYCPACFY